MTSFVDLAGATGADAPFTETVATALDRNLFAAMEGDSTAIAAGARFQTPALADGCVTPRKLSGGRSTITSTAVFDYLRIQGSRRFDSSTYDRLSPASYYQKAGTYRIKLTANLSGATGSESLQTALLINDVQVAITAATSGTTIQQLDAVYTIGTDSKIEIKSVQSSGSGSVTKYHSCSADVFTDEIFSTSQRQLVWGYNYDTANKFLISFRT
jgi:hypothetical protein